MLLVGCGIDTHFAPQPNAILSLGHFLGFFCLAASFSPSIVQKLLCVVVTGALLQG